MKKKSTCSDVIIDTGYTAEERDLLLSQSLYAPNVINIYDPPNDYRVLVILSTVFCFVPLGVLGMYFSSKARHYHRTGSFTKAAQISERTKLVLQLTFLIGCGVWLAGILALVHLLKEN